MIKEKKRISGQSVVEIVVSVAIFLIIVGSGVVTVLGSLSTSRLGEEETQATTLAVEGIEAVFSIRNQDWDNLDSGTYGLSNIGGSWTFDGASDVDPSGKFTREINLASVERDASGNIVASGGTTDPDTFGVTSTVRWYFTTARQNQVLLTTYITNWQQGISFGGGVPTTTPTPSSTPTPTPTVTINSCSQYCTGVGYSTGTCRQKVPDCSNNGEVYENEGNTWCAGSETRCCCLP